MSELFNKIKSLFHKPDEADSTNTEPVQSAKPEKTGRPWWYYAVMLVFMCSLVFSVSKISQYYKAKDASEERQQNIIDYYTQKDTSTATAIHADAKGDDSIIVDFAKMTASYPAVVGYIYGPDTPINFPIVQGVDDEYYLSHDIDGSENVNGAIFMEYQNNPNFSDITTVIYGHHMKTGRMFSALVNYGKQSYYDEHPYFYIYTPVQDYRLDLFAGFVCDATDGDVYQLAYDDNDIAGFIARSDFKTDVDTSEGKMVTLSTCSYTKTFSDERYVVMGILVPVE